MLEVKMPEVKRKNCRGKRAQVQLSHVGNTLRSKVSGRNITVESVEVKGSFSDKCIVLALKNS